jgi:hypothetical protein
MAEIKAVLTPYVTTSLSFMSMISFDFMSMLQSGFIASSFVGTYLLLVLVFMVGFVISALLRSWRATLTGLSAKAVIIIIGKQVLPSFILVSTLTIGISWLYAFLAKPQLSEENWSLLWHFGISSILIAFVLFIAWLMRRRGMWQPQRAPAQSLALPLQQQRRKRPQSDRQDERKESISGSGTRFWNTLIG